MNNLDREQLTGLLTIKEKEIQDNLSRYQTLFHSSTMPAEHRISLSEGR